MKKLNILGLISEDSAVGYYRIWQPLKMLEAEGLANLRLTPTFNWGRSKNEIVAFPNIKWFSNESGFRPDIIVAERHDHITYAALLGALKNYRVPVVVDTDDDVQAVRPFNPGYASYHPTSDNVAYNIKLMSIADAITTSTPHLKERHEQYHKPTYVVPNSIDVETRTFPRKKKRADGKVRIGWLGSACHWENLQIIQKPVKDIVANYPQVEFYYTNLFGDIWSNRPPELEDRVIPTCYFVCKEKHAACNKAYVDFKKYPAFMNKLNLDIGLAPLQDNLFNRSKSNLRILEYWADGVAVIASPVRPYAETITDGLTGLIAKEQVDWYNAIEKLILNAPLREKFQKRGFETLDRKYNAKKNAKRLWHIYQDIIRGYERGSNPR